MCSLVKQLFVNIGLLVIDISLWLQTRKCMLVHIHVNVCLLVLHAAWGGGKSSSNRTTTLQNKPERYIRFLDIPMHWKLSANCGLKCAEDTITGCFLFLPGLHGLPRRNGKLKDLSTFDAAFFGVSPKQADAMDPQLRLLLETAYECIVDAGELHNSINSQSV